MLHSPTQYLFVTCLYIIARLHICCSTHHCSAYYVVQRTVHILCGNPYVHCRFVCTHILSVCTTMYTQTSSDLLNYNATQLHSNMHLQKRYQQQKRCRSHASGHSFSESASGSNLAGPVCKPFSASSLEVATCAAIARPVPKAAPPTRRWPCSPYLAAAVAAPTSAPVLENASVRFWP